MRAETRGEYELRGERRDTARRDGWGERERDVPESERENENAPNASATRHVPVLEGHACGQKSEEMQKASSEGEALFTCLLIFFLICLFGMMNIKHMHIRSSLGNNK